MTTKLLSLILFVSILNSCVTEPNNEYKEYVIEVDKFSFTDTVSVDDSVNFYFDGIVGTSGCYQFKRIQSLITTDQIHFVVYGEYPSFDTACSGEMLYLDETKKLKFWQKGTYEVVVHQPDNSMMIDTIIVK